MLAEAQQLGLAERVDLQRQDIHAPTRSPGYGPLYDGIAVCEVLGELL